MHSPSHNAAIISLASAFLTATIIYLLIRKLVNGYYVSIWHFSTLSETCAQ